MFRDNINDIKDFMKLYGATIRCISIKEIDGDNYLRIETQFGAINILYRELTKDKIKQCELVYLIHMGRFGVKESYLYGRYDSINALLNLFFKRHFRGVIHNVVFEKGYNKYTIEKLNDKEVCDLHIFYIDILNSILRKDANITRMLKRIIRMEMGL